MNVSQAIMNFAIVTFPLFCYQLILNKSRGRPFSRPLSVFFMCGIAMLLSMSAPFTYFDNYRSDLKFIPLVTGTLYGGPVVGYGLCLLMAAAHWLKTGTGGQTALLFGVIVTSLTVGIGKYFRAAARNRRLLLALLLMVAIVLLQALLYRVYGLPVPLAPLAIYGMIQLGGITALVLLNENILDDYRMRQEYFRLEKLSLVSDLAASIAHEVRNPLTSVKGFLQMLRAEGVQEEKKLSYIDIATSELDRANQIISNYLSFGRDENASVEVIQAQDVVRQAVDVVSSYAVIGNVEIQVARIENVRLTANREKLLQCLINLIKNGVEAIEHAEGVIRISLYSRGRKAILEVSDNGKGMTQAQLERVGLPYQTSKENGTGLGLTFVYRTLTEIGGEVSVDSHPGKGTTIRMIAPLVEGGSEPSRVSV